MEDKKKAINKACEERRLEKVTCDLTKEQLQHRNHQLMAKTQALESALEEERAKAPTTSKQTQADQETIGRLKNISEQRAEKIKKLVEERDAETLRAIKLQALLDNQTKMLEGHSKLIHDLSKEVSEKIANIQDRDLEIKALHDKVSKMASHSEGLHHENRRLKAERAKSQTQVSTPNVLDVKWDVTSLPSTLGET